MPSPFPGMDPFLEHPDIFPDLHDALIAALREAVNEALPPPYYAGIGTRVWVESTERRIGPDVQVRKPAGHPAGDGGGVALLTEVAVEPIVVHVPQDEIREPFLEIRGAGGERLVTTIEILSPANKTPGAQGRDLYLRKQREVLSSAVNVVEIDLLRGGLHTTAVPRARAVASAGEFDYHVCVSRFDAREDFLVYPILLPQRLPEIRIPLLPEDSPVVIDLQRLGARCYAGGHYERRVRYDLSRVVPPLRASLIEWATSLVSSPTARTGEP